MRAIDQNHIVSISGQFVEFMGKLAQALTPIMEEMGKPSVMLRILGVTRERGEPTN